MRDPNVKIRAERYADAFKGAAKLDREYLLALRHARRIVSQAESLDEARQMLDRAVKRRENNPET